MKPQEIEELSFSIIDREAGSHGFDPGQWKIVQRMIHTSADFDYLKSIRFHPDAVARGVQALKNGCTIVTDTNMAKAGIRKKEIEAFGGRVDCFISHEDVVETAKTQEMTRAAAAVDKACSIKGSLVFVIGNAPTALMRLLENVRAGKGVPDLVIGLPVGFVNAAESKEDLVQTDIPFISNAGRKGGSNVAASVVNALGIMASQG